MRLMYGSSVTIPALISALTDFLFLTDPHSLINFILALVELQHQYATQLQVNYFSILMAKMSGIETSELCLMVEILLVLLFLVQLRLP